MLHTSLLTQHDVRRSSNAINWLPGTIPTWQGDRATPVGISQFSQAEVRVPEGEIVIKREGDKDPTWFRPTAQALIELLELSENWDSYRARSIDRNIVSYALQFLSETMQDDTPAPTVVPTNRGGVQLEWHTRRIDLEIEVQQPGRISVCYEDHQSGDEWEEEMTSDLTRLSNVFSEFSRRG